MRYIVLALLLITTLNCTAQNQLFGQLEQNLKGIYFSNNNRKQSLDALIRQAENGSDKRQSAAAQLPHTDSNAVNKLIRSFTANNTWNDLNYQDTRLSDWDPATHANRILTLTVLYSNPASPYYKNTGIGQLIHRALQYWFTHMPVCKNWWFNEIGVPKTLGPAFILLRDELSAQELTGAIAVMNHSSFKQTGQNKVWQAGNVLFKAILIKDAALARQSRDTIFSELRISSNEGIKADFSFQQHGPQLQSGNYGMGFLGSMALWSRVFIGTSLALDTGRLGILRQLINNGFNWLSWKGYFDINASGRQLFLHAQKDKAASIAYALMDMMLADPAHQKNYRDIIISNYSKQVTANQLTGTRHYWTSDFTIHRAANWYSSTKMSSVRVQATESGNGENLKGYYIGDGSTFIEVNGNEYEDIFPYWDWKKMPGVTNVQSALSLLQTTWAGYRNKGDFTGGITDGQNGITAFQLNRNGVTGNKAWFYINKVMVCLGANIHSDDKHGQLFTTINQTNLTGNVSYFTNKEYQLNPESALMPANLKWVFHNQIGYYFLKPDSVNMIAKTQSGKWTDIQSANSNHNEIKNNVFTLEIKHNIAAKNNSYAYVILPGIKPAQLRTYQPDFDIIQNDEQAQVIVNKSKTMMWLAVYQSAHFKIAGFPVIGSIQPGLYMMEKSGSDWKLLMVDPTQKLKSATAVIGGKIFQIQLPQGNNAGSTTTIKLTKVS